MGVVHSITPHEKPKMSLPKHIDQKLRTMVNKVPIMPNMLNLISVILLPFPTKSPPNILPRANPTMELVLRTVVRKSMVL